MPIIRQKVIRREDLWSHRHWIYLFGDNEMHMGYGGQAAAMRGEPNALGVRTKRGPGKFKYDYWSDDKYADCCRMIDEDLSPIFDAIRKGKTVVIPDDGLGTGLSDLPKRAPYVFKYLEEQLARLTKEVDRQLGLF